MCDLSGLWPDFGQDEDSNCNFDDDILTLVEIVVILIHAIQKGWLDKEYQDGWKCNDFVYAFCEDQYGSCPYFYNKKENKALASHEMRRMITPDRKSSRYWDLQEPDDDWKVKTDFSGVRPGGILFFSQDGSKREKDRGIQHVAIYLGKFMGIPMMIDNTSDPVYGVSIRPVQSISNDFWVSGYANKK